MALSVDKIVDLAPAKDDLLPPESRLAMPVQDLHHWSPGGAWMRGLRAHHRVHHKFPDCNFGVTMRLWDDVFGTRFRGHH